MSPSYDEVILGLNNTNKYPTNSQPLSTSELVEEFEKAVVTDPSLWLQQQLQSPDDDLYSSIRKQLKQQEEAEENQVEDRIRQLQNADPTSVVKGANNNNNNNEVYSDMYHWDDGGLVVEEREPKQQQQQQQVSSVSKSKTSPYVESRETEKKASTTTTITKDLEKSPPLKMNPQPESVLVIDEDLTNILVVAHSNAGLLLLLLLLIID